MNQQAALATRDNDRLSGPSVAEFGVLKEQAGMLIKSKFLPSAIQTPEQAIAIILTGRELGIGTMQALNTINVIQGKPTISPQLMLALIERSGQLEDIRIGNKISPDGKDAQVACTMKRRGRSEHTEIFGTKEAQALGLLGKDNYKKQPLTMLKWRAVAACARVVFPDVILGLYTPDEMGADTAAEPDEITLPPVEPKTTPTLVKLPQPAAPPSEPIQGEVVDPPKPDYSKEWEQALANPKPHQVAPVSPKTKGKLLWEAGCVSQTAKGYEVKDEEFGEYFEITKAGGVVRCGCADYTEKRTAENMYRCAHIEAVVLFAANQQRKAA